MQVPANLITTSWNLMELHKNTNDKAPPNQKCSGTMPPPSSHGLSNQNSAAYGSANQSRATSGQQVYMCHMKLQDKLLKVRIDSAISADGLSVENDYSTEVGNTEMERYRALHSCPDNNVKETINSYYDKQRLKLADQIEEKLDKLIEKAENMRKSVQINNVDKPTKNISITENVNKSFQSIPVTNQGASLLLAPVDDKDKLNAVRKLKFNTSDDNVNVDDDDDYYLNCSVNSEDFEIDEIDVETVDRKVDSGNSSDSNISVAKVNVSKQEDHHSDLLKQCIEQSGLVSLKPTKETLGSESANIVYRDNGEDLAHTTCDSHLPDSSTTDSPISIDSPAETSSQNLSPDDTNSSFNRGEHKHGLYPPINANLGQFFSTPLSGDLKFTYPDNLNIALSEMQKLCGGPTVSFTPEFRRDITHASFTPEIPKSSPFNELSNTRNGSYTRHIPNMKHGANQTLANEQYRWHNDTGTTETANAGSPSTDIQAPVNAKCHKITDTRNNNMNMNTGNNIVSSASGNMKEEELQFENTPVFRTHRMLNAEATNILSRWYHEHVQYPYPNDQEVDELSRVTGITGRQVKKWMANKRVRCFNTLSITGNQHPIKHKYQGKGRKRKTPTNEKENCDSTTNEMKANYTMLSDSAKDILNHWYEEHVINPYPSEDEKQLLAQHCGISVTQVKSWFANKRNRTNNTKRQVPNYFIEKFPEYSHIVQMVGQKREEERLLKRRKLNEYAYIQPPFYF